MREFRVLPHAQSVGFRSRARRIVRRQREHGRRPVGPDRLGTDTGGSIREPASFCNVVGVKPTYGRVSRYGIIAFASSLDQAGPMTADVRDAADTLRSISGHDPMDSTSIDLPVPHYADALREDLRGVRIGIVQEFEASIAGDAKLAGLYKAAYAELERLGATLVPVSLAHAKYGLATYYLIAPAECSSNFARYDGARYGVRVGRRRRLADVRAARDRGFWSRSETPHHPRHVRALFGLLRRVLRARAKGQNIDEERFRRSVRGMRDHREPGGFVSCISARREVRPGGDVLDGLFHDTDEPCRHSGDVCARRLRRRAAGRLQIAAPVFEEGRMLGVAHAYEQATRFAWAASPKAGAA